MTRFFAAAMSLVIAGNLVLLGHVAWNRSKTLTTFVLNERDLALPYFSTPDNSGIDLRMIWRTLSPKGSQAYYGRALITTDAKLQALGFRPDCGNDAFFAPRRRAWFALEFDGDTLARQYALDDQYLRKRREDIDSAKDPAERKNRIVAVNRLAEAQERQHQYGSRLYIEDVEADRSALEARYKGNPKVAVTSGTVVCGPLGLHVASMNIDAINVPRQFRATIAHLNVRIKPGTPRFSATVAFGRLGEPWIVDLKKL